MSCGQLKGEKRLSIDMKVLKDCKKLKIKQNKTKQKTKQLFKMKKLKPIFRIFFLTIFALVTIISCKEEEEQFTQFPTPIWQVNSAEYSVSMTAVVSLPQKLLPYEQEDDQLAAFSGDVCRGIGEKVGGLYYVLISGTPEDQSNIRFLYYSARNRYMYQTDQLFAFETNKIFGTADQPETLTLTNVK
jgi:hypothetical protein